MDTYKETDNMDTNTDMDNAIDIDLGHARENVHEQGTSHAHGNGQGYCKDDVD